MRVANMPDKMHKISFNTTIFCSGKSSHIPIFVKQQDSSGMVLHGFKVA
jgi:hypothetical protein